MSGDEERGCGTAGGSPIRHLYDVNSSLPVLLDDGTMKYVWGLGLAYAVDTAGNPLVYHADELGSVRALTDGSGAVVQTYRYDEYGVVTSSQGTITRPFQYTGEQRDEETGLVYLRARVYEPGTGRFTSRDIWPGKRDTPETANRYAYASSNPALITDPAGLAVVVPCRAHSGGIKGDADSAGGLSLDPCNMPPALVVASASGPSAIPGYVAFGIVQVASRSASTPMGRAIESLKSYVSTGQGAWRLFSVHLEKATSKVYTELGAEYSMEQIFTNSETGQRLVRHTVYNAEKVFEETFRDVARFGLR